MKLSITKNVHLIEPADFEPTEHWYPRALNSNIHPLVAAFMNLSHEQYAERYCRLYPETNYDELLRIFKYQPKYFRWSGTDLMYVTNQLGDRRLTVIETNSCPSGQKSMPLLEMNVEQGGYRRLIESTFLPMVQSHNEEGVLALIYDKNPMENIGYSATIADVFNENVYLAQFKKEDANPPVKFVDNKMYVKGEQDIWLPVRAAFRYVTQEPWTRLPQKSKTLLLNPIEACLAGGRNKAVAGDAYKAFNHTNKDKGLSIFTPETYRDVRYDELSEYFQKLGGKMVIKVPDSNAGQGVYTIVNQEELALTLKKLSDHKNDLYLVQTLISANYTKGITPEKDWCHVGTIPDSKGRSYAFDLRMMIHATTQGIRPLAIYSRRARQPLNKPLPEGVDSWEVYGTNLSVKEQDGWSYDDARLILFDVRNFATLGVGIDELLRGFAQSCMATYSIDQTAIKMFDD